jgi:hypothetical protein
MLIFEARKHFSNSFKILAPSYEHWCYTEEKVAWSSVGVISCLHLHMHHDYGNNHSIGHVVIVWVHIMYSFSNNMLKCVLDNVIEAFEYAITCESTHGINIIAIPLAKFDSSHHILNELIPCSTKVDQVIECLHHGYQTSQLKQLLKARLQCKIIFLFVILMHFQHHRMILCKDTFCMCKHKHPRCLHIAEQSIASCFHNVGHICKLLALLVRIPVRMAKGHSHGQVHNSNIMHRLK